MHDREPSLESFVLCLKSVLMSLLLASEDLYGSFLLLGTFLSSGSFPLGLSRLGDPAGSNVTAGLAVNVYWKPRWSPPGQGGDVTGWVLNIVCV